MTGHDDSSYDLSKASAIEARLRASPPDTPEPPSAEPPEEPKYVRFARASTRSEAPAHAAGTSEPQVNLADEVPWSEAMMGSTGWDHLLDWCAAALDAYGAMTADSRGLVIGSSGTLPAEVLEETGARLVIAFDQCDQMLRSHGSALSITVELESAWLTGIRVPIRESECLVVGMVGPLPLTHEARRKIANAFTKKALGV